MIDVIIILILAVPIGLAARYVYKAKKRGVKCIGCPSGSSCCSCQSDKPKKASAEGSCCCSESSADQSKK